MNKRIKVVTTFIAVCLGLVLAGTNAYATTGKALNDTTRIREKATTDSKVVTVLDKGEKVEVLSEEGDWYKIQYKSSEGKETGYVRKDLLEVEETSNKTEEKKTEETKKENDKEEPDNSEGKTNSSNDETNNNKEETTSEDSNTVVVEENAQISLSSDTEVQLLPIIFSCKTGKVSAKENITVIEVVGNWSHIQAEEIEGWVPTSKIENSSSTENVQKEEKQDSKQEEKNTEKEEEKVEEKKSDTSKAEGIDRKLYVSTKTLNLREKANANSTVVEQLDLNDEVTVLEVVDNVWSKVKVNGKVGYTATEYLSKKKVSDVTSRGSQEIRNSNEKKDETKKEESKQAESNSDKKENTTNTSTKNNNTSTNSNTSTSNNTSANNNTWKVTTSTNSNSTKTTETKKTETTKKEESKKIETKKEEKSTSNNKDENKNSNKSSSSGTKGSEVVAYAKKFLGVKYVYGATGPNSFDCSGFTSYVFKHFGYSLNRTSSAQRSNGTAVNKSDMQPGDLLCFSGHVGIYIGGNKFIHASHPGDYVKISSLSGYYTNKKPVIAVRRIIK